MESEGGEMHSMLQVISHKQEAGHVQFSRNALVFPQRANNTFTLQAEQIRKNKDTKESYTTIFLGRWGKSQSSHRYATFLSKRGKNKTSKDYILLTVYVITETGNIRN